MSIYELSGAVMSGVKIHCSLVRSRSYGAVLRPRRLLALLLLAMLTRLRDSHSESLAIVVDVASSFLSSLNFLYLLGYTEGRGIMSLAHCQIRRELSGLASDSLSFLFFLLSCTERREKRREPRRRLVDVETRRDVVCF